MIAIRYGRSCDHKMILDIGNKDPIIGSALVIATKQYKDDFRQLCKQFYKEGDKRPAVKTAIKEYKQAIRDYLAINEALQYPIVVTNKKIAGTIASKLF